MAKITESYMLLCACLSASEAIFIVVNTLVFVFALSRASLCISIVDNVPSICCSCFSYRFFRFNAAIAAENQNFRLIKRPYRIQNVSQLERVLITFLLSLRRSIFSGNGFRSRSYFTWNFLQWSLIVIWSCETSK